MIDAMAKTSNVAVWAGTRKGAFVFLSRDRRKWNIEGPLF